jgi:hypothetical protein
MFELGTGIGDGASNPARLVSTKGERMFAIRAAVSARQGHAAYTKGLTPCSEI